MFSVGKIFFAAFSLYLTNAQYYLLENIYVQRASKTQNTYLIVIIKIVFATDKTQIYSSVYYEWLK